MTSKLFSNKDLVRMIVPLFFEQFLLMLVGLADTFFISQAGEAAVAGVSLTNQFNTVFNLPVHGVGCRRRRGGLPICGNR